MIHTHHRRCATVGFALLIMLSAPPARAEIATVAPTVDTSTLPPIADRSTDLNPYRGNAVAIATGREAYHQSCAVCHGANADGSRMPAPDLRRVGQGCDRLIAGQWKRRCQSDADFYFKTSVEEGKVKVGVRHMPAWKALISTEVIWAIRSFVENARREQRKE